MIRKLTFTEALAEFNPGRRLAELPDVAAILSAVEARGDSALQQFTRQLDGVDVVSFRVKDEDLKAAAAVFSPKQATAVKQAIINLKTVARQTLQRLRNLEIEVQPGIKVGIRLNPIRRVGVYVPGGKYPLISTLLMCVVPALEAGVPEIIICTPPTMQGKPATAILGAAKHLGIQEVYGVGGAQSIAAMAYGTEQIAAVDKIVGPGNAWVSAAKKAVSGRVGIDFIAGPTEVAIVADESARPDFIAADMLAQAEHDERAAAVLITPSETLAGKVEREIATQLEQLPTAPVARRAIAGQSAMVVVKSDQQAVALCNAMAPEHLELQTRKNEWFSSQLTAYGTLFIGEHSVEALGDYNCGVNHTLPTNGVARYRGGLSVLDFIKVQTTLQVKPAAFATVAESAVALAELEGLAGHAASIRKRLKDIS
jgi:histidinol dehydrogenase